MSYSLVSGSVTGAPSPGVKRDVDGACIPCDPVNADWREYEVWLAAGNQPRAAPQQAAATREVALWQARVALAQNGLLEKADAAIAASGDPALRAVWEYGNTISRQSASLAALAKTLGLTPSQIDELFVEAAGIKV